MRKQSPSRTWRVKVQDLYLTVESWLSDTRSEWVGWSFIHFKLKTLCTFIFQSPDSRDLEIESTVDPGICSFGSRGSYHLSTTPWGKAVLIFQCRQGTQWNHICCETSGQAWVSCLESKPGQLSDICITSWLCYSLLISEQCDCHQVVGTLLLCSSRHASWIMLLLSWRTMTNYFSPVDPRTMGFRGTNTPWSRKS